MAESSSLRLLALSLVVPQRNRFVDAELAGRIGELPRKDLIGMLKGRPGLPSGKCCSKSSPLQEEGAPAVRFVLENRQRCFQRQPESPPSGRRSMPRSASSKTASSGQPRYCQCSG